MKFYFTYRCLKSAGIAFNVIQLLLWFTTGEKAVVTSCAQINDALRSKCREKFLGLSWVWCTNLEWQNN